MKLKLWHGYLLVGLVAVTAMPASAFLFGGVIVNDVGANIKLIDQYVRQGQQYATQAQQYAAELKNLARMPTSFAQVQAEVAQVSSQAKSIPATVRGTAAANQIIINAPTDAANTARINQQAAVADGAQQQAQVTNQYLGQINDTLQQKNAADAVQRQQEAANAVDTASDLTTMTGNGAGAPPQQQL